MAHALLSDSTDVHSTGQMAAEKAAKEAVTHPEVKERPGDAKGKKSSVFMSMMLPAAAVFTPFTKYAHVW